MEDLALKCEKYEKQIQELQQRLEATSHVQPASEVLLDPSTSEKLVELESLLLFLFFFLVSTKELTGKTTTFNSA